MVSGIEVVGARTLGEASAHVDGSQRLAASVVDPLALLEDSAADIADYADVRGQSAARRAFEVAAAGSHNLVSIVTKDLYHQDRTSAEGESYVCPVPNRSGVHVPTVADFLRRIEELSETGRRAIASEYQMEVGGMVFLDDALTGEFRSRGLALISATVGQDHPYYSEFADKYHTSKDGIKGALGVLEAMRKDLEGGYLTELRGLISAEIFTDFIEMAGHLLQQKYKSPAAVVAGSALEAHLRRLAMRHNIDLMAADQHGVPRPRRAQAINQDLCKASVYTAPDQKMVTAWLDIRNKAAHGEESNVIESHVEGMLLGIPDFILRHPAL